MIENNPKISIVIPIYNVEKYLSNCIESITNQSFQNYEMILVNDGSKDSSLEICYKYKKNNNKIKIVNKENGGLSSARNAGIKIAKGKYIVFIDPDDEIDKNYFNTLYTIAEENNCDFVVGNYVIVPGGQKVTSGYNYNTVLNGKDFILSNKNIHTRNDLCFVWRNIYKLDIIKKNNIKFNEEVFIGEDVIFNIEFFLKSKKGYATDKIIYYYRVDNPNSLMRASYKPKLESSLIKQYEIRKKLSIDYHLLNNKDYRKDMANYYIKNIYTMIINNLRNGNQENIEEKIIDIINYKMFKDNTKILGFSYKCENIKEYVYYLALKFRIKHFIIMMYKKV